MAVRGRVLSVATAVPEHLLPQKDVAIAAGGLFASRMQDFQRLSAVFQTAGIRMRHAARPIAWYQEQRGWPERTAVYLETAGALFVEAAEKALAAAGLEASQVDAVVTVSSTGIATPSLEARVKGRLGLRDDVQRTPVFGLGCAGGVTGLAIANRLAMARPGSIVLLVAVELCTLSFRLDEFSKANVVATALFGDGAAACILRAGEGISAGVDGFAEIEMAGEHTWPDTLDIMGWKVDPAGFGVIFDRAIPPFAEKHVGAAVAGILASAKLELSNVDRFLCHPGGVKVITAMERALELDQGSLDIEREVLADNGNMSAPTALFVLERANARGLPRRSVLTAMGPGFSASCVSLLAA